MKNVHSETGIIEDFIRSITQMICAEMHLKTLIEKANAKLDNGLFLEDGEDDITDDEYAKRVDKVSNDLTYYNEELNSIADLRRKMMLKLYNMGQGDKLYWCQVKHLAGAAYTAHEAYLGSDDDTELYELALEVNGEFVRALTHFLGFKVTSCASCFDDMMKGEM